MKIINSEDKSPGKPLPLVSQAIAGIDKPYLQRLVKAIAIPRHRLREEQNNKQVADYIKREFQSVGLSVQRQGPYENLIASKDGSLAHCRLIIGAHYDSVPKSPGADDNASAVAGMLAAARALSALTDDVAYIAFNGEEDGLIGSRDLVQNYLPGIKHRIRHVHILEMIGYASDQAGSQSLPRGLPVKVSDVGNFLAIIANRHSNQTVEGVLQTAADYTPQLPVKALKVFMGMEKLFPHLLRSDHSPFWEQKIPAFMWTDTSEFRNPHYHKSGDLPDTLNYDFLLQVTHLLVAHSLQFVQNSA